MSQKYYVALTGSKTNAGDHLIRHQAFKLLARIRPDRKVVDMNGWEPMDAAKLATVNGAQALLLLGGPALARRMVPKVYNIDPARITVPIISFGIGWHSASTSLDTSRYGLSGTTLKTVARLAQHAAVNSVRDAPTHEVLKRYGVGNVELTGCPALYDLEKLESDIEPYRSSDIQRIGFSLGVSFKQSRAMREQMQGALRTLREAFPASTRIVVAFHHPLGDRSAEARKAGSRLLRVQGDFADWLDENGFEYEDISGSHEKLMKFYEGVDLHVGYRVHAHIFMSSQNKPSILISEDGRGAGLHQTVGGAILDGISSIDTGIMSKLLLKLKPGYDRYSARPGLLSELDGLLRNESALNEVRLASKRRTRELWTVMNRFLGTLP